ncbi:hypothetical protein BOTNAR_0351g00070 [Botryotinia narcissicola]|uniref:Uncharacterized protein n=1 Tax=Botryotinia narcissicola TaxID=278944 RepID=A0A4Z1HRY2_9HELO|nr:hypothetical protein BOTNAR_0351g00070 [Botryotinia narcissicola]
MNEGFSPRDQPDGRMFFVRCVEEYLTEWVGNHPDPRQVEMPENETDWEEEGGDEEDDDGGREAVTEKAPEEQGEDGQDNQGAQDAGNQEEEGEDNDTD